ncbi:hypothetical protein ACWCQS_21910 [Streptomyces sp. NPDC002076]
MGLTAAPTGRLDDRTPASAWRPHGPDGRTDRTTGRPDARTGLTPAPVGRVCAARCAPHLASRDSLVVQQYVDEDGLAVARAFAAFGESRRLP